MSNEQLDFYKRVTGKEKKTRTKVFEDGPSNHEAEFTLQEVDKAKVLDQMSMLPEAMLDLFDEVEDEEEAQERAREQNMLSKIDGKTIEVFEELVVLGLSNEHNELTRHHFEDLVKSLSFEVLFEAGAEVIEMSLDEDDAITGFRDPDSDKSS